MADTPKQDRNLGLPREQIGKRFVTAYDPRLAIAIVEQLAEGKLLKEICTEENGMPHKTTFMKWVSREPELAQAYMAARELSAMSMEEEAIDVSRNLLNNPGTAQRVSAANTLINQLRWSAARRDPKQFGDRASTQITVPIHITTSLDMGGGGGSIAELPDIYTIDVTPEKTEGIKRVKNQGGKGIPSTKKRQLTPPNPDYDPFKKAMKEVEDANSV